MFHFKRRTLWIIIYTLIPLIYFLNSLGPDKTDHSEMVQPRHWSLDTVEYGCDENQCSLPLAGAEQLYISVISDFLPTEKLAVPDGLAVTGATQGGRFVVTLITDSSRAQVKKASRFLKRWLPEADEKLLVVSGALDSATMEQLAILQERFDGKGTPYVTAPVSGLGILQSPPLGDESQLAFLMWVEVLNSRLAGYEVTAQWDHSRAISYAVFSSTLHAENFKSVEITELTPIVKAYIQSADNRQRTAGQLHRYAVTAAVYQLPFRFFVEQKPRLQSITLAQVNQQRELSLEQIQKTNGQ